MRIEDLNWMDIEEYLKRDDRLMLVIGACEQHGYLSLLTDIKIPLALADAASTRTGVLVAPPLNFGSSPYFLAYPGTFSLRLSTLMDAVEDILRSAYGQGFRRILVLNGHGGNSGVKARLTELANELAGLQIQWYAWWMAHSVEEIAIRHEVKPAHANWLEAFPFTIVADLPEGEKVPPRVPSEVLDAAATREVYGDGSFGGRYRVPQETMQEIFDAALADILHLLEFES
ncbi:MAG: creatinine amidohydrolase [Anaerolineaceae bacterium]|nr:MAG: creatinine amidohydrolase [Anaerolineaceae bacterium]